MVPTAARLGGMEISHAAVEHGMDIFSGQARCVEQSIDIDMRRVNRLCECAPVP